MRNMQFNLPQLVLLGATRGMIGLGVGLLIADRLQRDRRKSIGWTLFGLGALSTVPLAITIFRKREAESRRAAMMD
jgi:hypothetical protein